MSKDKIEATLKLPTEITQITLPALRYASDKEVTTTTLGEVLEQCLTGSDGLSKKIDDVRQARKAFENNESEQNKNHWKKLKEKLPGIFLSGYPDGRIAKTKKPVHTGILQIDIDHEKDPQALKDRLAGDKHILFCALSPSGNGVKAGMRIPKHPGINHDDSFYAAQKYIKNTFDTEIDASCRPKNKFMFIPHDPETAINPDAVELDVSQWQDSNEVKIENAQDALKNFENKPKEKWFPEENNEEVIRDALKKWDASDREKWIRYGMALKNSKLPRAYEIWVEWSRTAERGFMGEADCKRTWEGLKPDFISINCIFEDALEKSETGETNITKLPFAGGEFQLRRDSVYYCPPPKASANGDIEPQEPLFICSRLEVRAYCRNVNSDGWGRFLSWTDPDKELHQWACPASLLESVDGSEVRRELAEKGLQISPNRKAREFLLVYIKLWPVELRVRSVEKLGWHNGVYVTSNEAIGSKDDEPVMLQLDSPIQQANQQTGSLEDWKNSLGHLAKGNSCAQFVIACAAAAPLLELSGVEGGGFHLRGPSSSGKTSLLLAASSFYGLPEEAVRGWRSTSNALEGLAALHNDGFLTLDEISEIAPEHAGEAAFLLANGKQKARANRTGSARQVLTWKLLFLSTGEESLSNLMARVRRKPTPGQELRLLDIPADAGAGLGVFEQLHDLQSGAALALSFKDASGKFHGTVGRAWLRWVVEKREYLAEQLPQRIQIFTHKYVPEGSSGQVNRAARRFGLVAAAGDLIAHLGFCDWDKEETELSIVKCFQDWLREFGSGPKEDQNILKQVRLFFEKHGGSRFEPLERGLEDNRVFPNRAGFWRNQGDEKEYLVLPEVFREEICAGLDHKNAIRVLLNDQRILQDNDKKHAQQNIRLPGLGQTRCYVFSSKGWD